MHTVHPGLRNPDYDPAAQNTIYACTVSSELRQPMVKAEVVLILGWS